MGTPRILGTKILFLPVLVTDVLLIDASHSHDAVNHKKVDAEQVIKTFIC